MQDLTSYLGVHFPTVDLFDENMTAFPTPRFSLTQRGSCQLARFDTLEFIGPISRLEQRYMIREVVGVFCSYENDSIHRHPSQIPRRGSTSTITGVGSSTRLAVKRRPSWKWSAKPTIQLEYSNCTRDLYVKLRVFPYLATDL